MQEIQKMNLLSIIFALYGLTKRFCQMIDDEVNDFYLKIELGFRLNWLHYKH